MSLSSGFPFTWHCPCLHGTTLKSGGKLPEADQPADPVRKRKRAFGPPPRHG